jgi:hypothetical protein
MSRMLDKIATNGDTTISLQMFKFGNAMPNQNGMHKAVKV